MHVLDSHVARRKEINQFYSEKLDGFPGVSLLKNPSADFVSNHWLTCVMVNEAEAGFSREELRLAMEAANIETRPLWKPMHLQPVFADAPYYGDGTSEKLFETGLCLPSSPVLTEEDLMRVVNCIFEMNQTSTALRYTQ